VGELIDSCYMPILRPHNNSSATQVNTLVLDDSYDYPLSRVLATVTAIFIVEKERDDGVGSVGCPYDLA